MRSKRISLNSNVFSVCFIVIVCTLLVTSMPLPMPFACGRKLDLPKVYASTPMRGATRKDALTVAITRDGTVFFASDKVRPDELAAKIREQLKLGAEKKVYINAEARTRYGTVVQVLDSVRDAGIQNVAFLVEQRKPMP